MAQVPATSYESTSLGDVAEFTIPFPFLSRAEVFVTVDGAPVAFTWINDGLVQLAEIPELGAVVRRYRSTTAYVPLHQFSQGVPFLPRYVDRDFKQTLYAVQESVNDTAGTSTLALDTAELALDTAQDALALVGERTQYMVLGAYGPGLHFQTTSQVFSYLGEFYAPGPSITLPYTTTGAGTGEIASFRSVGDAVLRADLLAADGAERVGRGAGTVETALDAIESVNSSQAASIAALISVTDDLQPLPAGIIANNGGATARNITLIGDSISHGAFAINSFMHAWARIFNRMINAETGSSSYGYTNWQTLGSGGTTTTEIHNVFFGGPAWGGIAATSAEAAASPTGAALRAGGVGSTMTFGLPFFQARAEMHYIQQPGGGTFTIKVNGGLVATVNTDGVLGRGVSAFNLADVGVGYVTIVIEQTVAGNVDIVGPSYLSAAVEPVFNNWAESGRRLRYMGEAIISNLMAESSTLVMALGHNDQGDADADATYYGEFVQRINWLIQYAKQYNVKVVVPDFCWLAVESSRARAELRRLAAETGGIYINLPKMIFSGDIAVSTTHLIDTLKMWTDGSHPNKDGHKWIAETVARAMGLSCATKRDAIRLHDFWMPLPLDAGGGATNYDVTSIANTSAYRRTGDLISVKVFVRKGGGAFPVGSITLCAAFNAKSELYAAQGLFSAAYVRTDTGAVVSAFSCSQGGAITLNVLSSFINEQVFSFSAPIAAGYI